MQTNRIFVAWVFVLKYVLEIALSWFGQFSHLLVLECSAGDIFRLREEFVYLATE